ncbi:MAG: hypothetical protein ACP5GS_05605 [Nitrososphaeria archaeon]
MGRLLDGVWGRCLIRRYAGDRRSSRNPWSNEHEASYRCIADFAFMAVAVPAYFALSYIWVYS